MRNLAVCGLLALAAACASTETASAPEPIYSWGKADVTLVQYWTDSAECTLAAAQAERNVPVATYDLNDSRQPIGMTRSFAGTQGNFDINSDPSIVSLNDQIMRARLNERQQALADRDLRQDVVSACLIERGYRPFQLTAEQAARLARLRDGSTQRRRYLHSLGSDPAVLAAQSVS